MRLAAVCAISAAAVCFSIGAYAAKPSAKVLAKKPKSPESASSTTETFQNLIEKAQNLSLQKDRLQASQILVRAITHESKGSPAYRDLTKALDELMTTFYTERAQSTFVAAESNLSLKPREAIEGFAEALRLEDGNVTILKALARSHLVLNECDKADGFVKSAEALDPFAAEIELLRLQVLSCSNSRSLLSARLFPPDVPMSSMENFVRGMQVKDLIQRTETKRAKALLAQWQTSAPDYPEVYYWKWMFSKDEQSQSAKPDRVAAQKYVQLCQNLTPRKRKSFNLDVDLCKGKESVDSFLKEAAHED
jgi:hypothetical protein